MSLAAVRDLRVARRPATPDDLEALEADMLAGFVLARAAAGLSDGTIASDVVHLEQVPAWFGRPLWEMEPADADVYFGKVLRDTAKGTRLSRAQAGSAYAQVFSMIPRRIVTAVFGGSASMTRRFMMCQ